MLCPTRHLVRHVLHLVRDLFEILLLAVCSVAIRLVHANALLFLSLEIDHFRMLFASVLGHHCDLRDWTHAVLRLCQRCCERFLLLSECQMSKEVVDPSEGGCVSA